MTIIVEGGSDGHLEHSTSGNGKVDATEENAIHEWKGKSLYYFNSMETKIAETFEKSSICTTAPGRDGKVRIRIQSSPSAVALPTQMDEVNVAAFPPDQSIVKWWKSIQKPVQMRQEPLLCDEPYTKKRPLFDANGCQLPTYMHPSAPRCQSSILKEICRRSKIDKNSSIVNGFVLPEANHAHLSFIPPTPFVITARNAFVTMCGQILHATCGLIHLTTSCLAQFQREQASILISLK